MLAALSAGSVLAGAAEDVNNFGDTRGGALAGPLGLFIVVMLGAATVFLIRNMNKRLRRLPSSFPGQEPPAGEEHESPSDEGTR
jgi:hypothetical protein